MIDRDSVIPPPNLAREATVSASSHSTIGPAFGPASAIDGNLATRWNSAAWTKSDGKEQQWLQLSWNAPGAFTTIRIHWGETCAKRYRIEVSDNGNDWRTVKVADSGKGGMEEWVLPRTTARHLRLFGLEGTGGRSTISAYSVREIEVLDYSRGGEAAR